MKDGIVVFITEKALGDRLNPETHGHYETESAMISRHYHGATFRDCRAVDPVFASSIQGHVVARVTNAR